ncbi:MAG: hypothetical protein HY741_13140 [Chloroflexi bacterium]|nr:hypothetical protein [Chloroflexota bacterium]
MAKHHSNDNGSEGYASALDALFWRDEILQVMFWMRGESLGDSPTASELAAFLNTDADLLRHHLEQMVRDDFAARARDNRYALTERGRKEGGRLFVQEFSGLTGQAHGECNNPNCSCKTHGPAACESRTTHARH